MYFNYQRQTYRQSRIFFPWMAMIALLALIVIMLICFAAGFAAEKWRNAAVEQDVQRMENSVEMLPKLIHDFFRDQDKIAENLLEDVELKEMTWDKDYYQCHVTVESKYRRYTSYISYYGRVSAPNMVEKMNWFETEESFYQINSWVRIILVVCVSGMGLVFAICALNYLYPHLKYRIMMRMH